MLEPVFGELQGGNRWNSWSANYKGVTKFSLAAPATIDGIILRHEWNSASATTRALIYADNAGAPGALLAYADRATVLWGLNEYLFAAPLALVAGSYWIGFHSSVTSHPGTRGTTGSIRVSADAYTDGPTDPFGAASNYTNQGNLNGAAARLVPDPVDVLFGSLVSSPYYTAWGWAPNYKAASEYTLSADAPVKGLRIRCGREIPATKLRGLIYAHDASTDRPGALIAQTPERVGVVAGLNDLPFAADVPLVAGKYWLGLIADGDVQLGSGSPAGTGLYNGSVYNSDSYADGATNPFGDLGGSQPFSMNIAAYGDPAPPPPPPAPITVVFDGIPGTDAVAISATEVEVTIPAHAAGAVDVGVTIDDETGWAIGTALAAFTYVALIITPSHGPTYGGNEVEITGFAGL